MPRHPLATVVLVAALATSSFAAPVPPPPEGGDRSAVRKARAALAATVTCKVEDKSIPDAAQALAEAAGVPIALDAVALLAVHPKLPDATVTFDVAGVTLRDALRTAFAPYPLACGVTGTGLVLSSADGLAAAQLGQRVCVDAADRPLAAVLKGLAERTGGNVAVDPRAGKALSEAAVTLSLDDVPLEVAVRLAAEVAGGGVVRMGNALFVTTADRAAKLRAEADRVDAPAGGVAAKGDGERESRAERVRPSDR